VRPLHCHGAFLRGDGASTRTQIALRQIEYPGRTGAAARFNIRSIPTLMVFRAGKEIARQSGAMDAATLTRWLNSVV